MVHRGFEKKNLSIYCRRDRSEHTRGGWSRLHKLQGTEKFVSRTEYQAPIVFCRLLGWKRGQFYTLRSGRRCACSGARGLLRGSSDFAVPDAREASCFASPNHLPGSLSM